MTKYNISLEQFQLVNKMSLVNEIFLNFKVDNNKVKSCVSKNKKHKLTHDLTGCYCKECGFFTSRIAPSKNRYYGFKKIHSV